MHCGSVAGPARQKELTLDESYRIADEIIELGCKELTFIGGEIFLYPGWEKIASYLSQHKIAVNIMSNGFRIGEKEIDQIKFAHLSNVGISLDGTEETHNRIRGNKHSFSQIQKAFNLLNQAKIPIGVVTSIMTINYPALEAVYQILIENNVNLWQIQLVNPMGNMAGKKDLILNRKHIPHLINFVREKNKEKNMLIVAADNVGYYYDDNEAYIRGTKSPFSFWEGCMAGINSLFIDSVGNVKGCGALYDKKFIEGNIKQNSLAEIWNNNDNFSYNRKFKAGLLSGNCKDCDAGSVCKGGCRASNYFMTNSLYENAFCPHKRKTSAHKNKCDRRVCTAHRLKNMVHDARP
jgi:radical SAM protein with 4Fe4S-binding SPASM domain